MARQNEARNRTAFTVSIEAREGIATGISAHDRARTIATAIDPTKDFNDIVSPGHVFPLIAREGGVLVRAGHTEASVDLARLAGLYPAGVICEIMNDDGTMARMPDLVAFAQRHGLKIGTIEDLIGYRLRHDQIVKQVARPRSRACTAAASSCTCYETAVEPVEHLALVKGDLSAPGPVLVRVHAVNVLDRPARHRRGRPARLAPRQGDAGDRRGGPRRDRAHPRPAAQVGVRLDRAERRAQAPRRSAAERRLVEIGVGSQILRALGVKRHGAAVERAALALRRRRGLRAAHRRPAPDRLRPWPARDSGRPRPATWRAPARSARTSSIIEAPYYKAVSEELAAGAIAELEARRRHLRARSPCRARWRSRRRWPRP